MEDLQRELVANISHDLRTPLTMIIGYSEAMRDIPGENTPENIQVVIDEAKRLNTLVNDVLDISKLQSGTQTLSLKEFNLTRSIQEILLRYNKLVDYDIRFQFTEEIWVRADELKISQVVYNLVNNAITYTGRDKKVTIIQSLPSARPGYVQVEVQDTGEGLEQNQLQDIWQRYYKVDKSHKRAQIGTGLGLSMSKPSWICIPVRYTGYTAYWGREALSGLPCPKFPRLYLLRPTEHQRKRVCKFFLNFL